MYDVCFGESHPGRRRKSCCEARIVAREAMLLLERLGGGLCEVVSVFYLR